MSEQVYCVYKHTSPSGKAYIGQTNNYNHRCKQHVRENKKLYIFHNAIKKYGWDNFNHEILKKNLTLEQANYWEKRFIKEYNTLSPYGYNLTTGGDNIKFSEESIKKRSDFYKKKENIGKHSLLMKEKLSTKEYRDKKSKIMKDVLKDPIKRKNIIDALIITNKNPEVRKIKSEKSRIQMIKEHEKRRAIKIEKQKAIAEEWNNTELKKEKGVIPIIFEWMQTSIF